MKSSFLKTTLFATTALVATVFVQAHAANVPLLTGPGGTNPAQFPADLPDINNTINAINSTGASGINPNTLAMFSNPRNYVDNGGIDIAQRGVAAITGTTTGGCSGKDPSGGYTADRWCVYTNVTSGTGKGQVVTATPTARTGFTNSLNVWRDSGALTQPVCVIQEIPTADSTDLQGQTVTFSAYLQALAGLNADNGSIVNMYVLYGTGSDQGLASLTASPAVTPAWTGINSSITGAKTITTAWVRYSISGTVPVTATEIGVQICFTPTATGAGTTDGFSLVGAQLEVGSTPSSFEFRPLGWELTKSSQYFMRFNESTTSTNLNGFVGLDVTSAQCSGILAFPVAMRTAPGYTNQLTATTFGLLGTPSNLTTPAALSTPFSATLGAATTTAASVKFTTASTFSLGSSCLLQSVNGGGKMDFSADF